MRVSARGPWPALALWGLAWMAAVPAAPAWAATTAWLSPEAGVEGPFVRLGDITRLSDGDAPETRRLAGLVVAEAPPPGGSLQLARREVAARLSWIGHGQEVDWAGAEAVRIIAGGLPGVVDTKAPAVGRPVAAAGLAGPEAVHVAAPAPSLPGPAEGSGPAAASWPGLPGMDALQQTAWAAGAPVAPPSGPGGPLAAKRDGASAPGFPCHPPPPDGLEGPVRPGTDGPLPAAAGEEGVRQAVRGHMASLYPDPDIRIAVHVRKAHALPEGPIAFVQVLRGRLPGSAQVVVRGSSGDGVAEVSATVDAPALLLARSVEKGQPVTAADVRPGRAPLAEGVPPPLARMPEGEAWVAAHRLAAGKPLGPEDMARPWLIEAKDVLAVAAAEDGWTVQARAIAQENARLGDRFLARDTDTGAAWLVLADGPGHALFLGRANGKAK